MLHDFAFSLVKFFLGDYIHFRQLLFIFEYFCTLYRSFSQHGMILAYYYCIMNVNTNTKGVNLNMKVILKSDVSKLGKAGSLLEVSDGYARNFLLPKNLAIEATPGKISEWKAQQARNKAKDEKRHAEALELQKKLQGRAITITGKAGDNGKLFGSITASQIAEALEAQHGLTEIDKRDIKLDETVKQPGNFKFALKLYPGVNADMTLTVSVN